ncbi:hypothetical protein H072_9880 [Dactylellina haptotyla CBS 200.50]|uniref:Nuclear transport factor 2 n=1 Tax=Dactylellina haptotyla (strain CBS 200.50) TaxID=1284197 RepID=S8BMV5_DACHA|nr:hypothetical protein H072_9880 [Dactylellina haptotyla CBS 200.50]
MKLQTMLWLTIIYGALEGPSVAKDTPKPSRAATRGTGPPGSRAALRLPMHGLNHRCYPAPKPSTLHISDAKLIDIWHTIENCDGGVLNKNKRLLNYYKTREASKAMAIEDGSGDYASVADQFVKFYYDTFDTNRPALQSLYRPSSFLTFESSQSAGVADIHEKLTNLPFEKVKHNVTTTDAQPVSGGAGIIVLVTGSIQVDDQPKPLNFSQSFLLMNDGSWHVAHDVFKLIFPAE